MFAGFTATSLKDRIVDSQSKWVCTADVGKRGSKTIKLKEITDAAVNDCPNVERVFVFKRTGEHGVPYHARDVHMDLVVPKMRPYCHAEAMGSEETMFTLYTSGSTGKPKGVAHSYAGYLLFAAMTTKYSFDLRDDDVFACVADVGWITGHSYIVYGPLCNGATTGHVRIGTYLPGSGPLLADGGYAQNLRVLHGADGHPSLDGLRR